MNKLGILEIPGFYKFVRRKMRHKTKIRNKERMGYRGPKQRYSVWRAEYNQKWEPLEGARPLEECLYCEYKFEIRLKQSVKDKCPQCGKKYTVDYVEGDDELQILWFTGININDLPLTPGQV